MWKPPTDPVPEPPFTVDAARDFITVECSRCLWMADFRAPVALNEVTFRADEHARRCNPG